MEPEWAEADRLMRRHRGWSVSRESEWTELGLQVMTWQALRFGARGLERVTAGTLAGLETAVQARNGGKAC